MTAGHPRTPVSGVRRTRLQHRDGVEAYRLRGIALHALFRVQLLASGQAVIDAARHACTTTDDMHKAADRTELSARGAQARDALEDFVEIAASDVR